MVAVYMALLVAMIITAGSITLSGILARQIKSSSDVVANEQAFYLADSGSEAVLFDLKNKIDSVPLDESLSDVKGTIDYQDFQGTFSSTGKLAITEDKTRTVACVKSDGKAKAETRRVAIGASNCGL